GTEQGRVLGGGVRAQRLRDDDGGQRPHLGAGPGRGGAQGGGQEAVDLQEGQLAVPGGVEAADVDVGEAARHEVAGGHDGGQGQGGREAHGVGHGGPTAGQQRGSAGHGADQPPHEQLADGYGQRREQ